MKVYSKKVKRWFYNGKGYAHARTAYLARAKDLLSKASGEFAEIDYSRSDEERTYFKDTPDRRKWAHLWQIFPEHSDRPNWNSWGAGKRYLANLLMRADDVDACGFVGEWRGLTADQKQFVDKVFLEVQK